MPGAGAVRLRREIALPVAIAMIAAGALLALRAVLAPDPIEQLAPAPRRDGDPAAATARAGSVELPRGGPYRFAIEARGPAHAEVAGQAISTNPLAPTRIVLQPGATERLSNVLHERWAIDDATGVLSFTIEGDGGLFPVVQGDSYNNAHPERRFGQALAAFTDADAAGAGQGQYLVGLRQDEDYRTIFWLFNPGNVPGSYEVVYRKLDGTVLGRVDAGLPAGRSRQFRPADHPLPAAGLVTTGLVA